MRLGLKIRGLQYSLLAAATDLRLKDRAARAGAAWKSALPEAERLGARTLLADAHHLLAVIDAADRNQAEARRQRKRHDNSWTPSARTPEATRCSAARISSGFWISCRSEGAG